MSVIIPAVLTDDLADFTQKLKFIESFPGVTSIHIDFTDGKFVANQTLAPAKIPSLPLKYQFAAHLMVQDPASYLEDLQRAGFEAVSFHWESLGSIDKVRSLLENIKSEGFVPQIAINPRTDMHTLIPVYKIIECVHIMTVEPGFYGRTYIPGEDRVKFLREHDFYGTIVVDGGIKKDNARSLLLAGADNLVVGSGIFKTRDPVKAYEELMIEVGDGE